MISFVNKMCFQIDVELCRHQPIFSKGGLKRFIECSKCHVWSVVQDKDRSLFISVDSETQGRSE